MSNDIMLTSKRKKMVIMMLMLVVVAGTICIFSYFYKNHLALASERESLNGTGTIEAKNVLASFKVPGQIESLFVDEGSKVEKGQELAVLGSREIEAKLAQAKGAQEAAQGQVQQANNAVPLTSQTIEAKIQAASALVAKAKVGVTNAEQQYNRVKELHSTGAVSDSQLDQARNAYEAARSDLEVAQGNLTQALSARMQISVAKSQYSSALGQKNQAMGAVEEAEAFLDNTHLKAPIAGYITQKVLEAGEMVNAGTPIFEITDIQNTYVKIFIDESKIGRVSLNQEAEVRVDSFPEKVFTGKVVWINDAGEFAVHKAINEQYSHDIRSFEVKIDLPNDDLLLKTGMTATVKILNGEK